MSDKIDDVVAIKGILRQASALQVKSYVVQNEDEVLVNFRMTGDILRSKTNVDSIQLDRNDLEDEVLLSFELDGSLYSMVLNRKLNSIKDYELPKTILVGSKRLKNRLSSIDVSNLDLVVEMRFFGGFCFGKILNFDSSHLLCSFNSNFISDEIENLKKVHIRAFRNSRQIFTRNFATIVRVEKNNDSFHILFDLTFSLTGQVKGDVSPGRSQRWSVLNGYNLNLSWPSADGVCVSGIVKDASYSGFRLLLKKCANPIPLGAICEIQELGIRSVLIRQQDNELGFSFLESTFDSTDIWEELLEDWSGRDIHNLSENQKKKLLFQIMSRSGYLKGGKIKPFEDGISSLPIPAGGNVREWLFRYVVPTDLGKSSAHVSIVRISDSGWLLQEVASFGSKGEGTSLLNQCLQWFHSRENSDKKLEKTFIIYDESSSFNKKYWQESKSKNFFKLHTIYAEKVILKSTESKDVASSVEIEKINLSQWESVYEEVKKVVPRDLLLGFSICESGFGSDALARSLATSGFKLDRQVLLIKKNGEVLGLIVIPGLPTLSNLTTTTNHSWILVKNEETARAAINTLSRRVTAEGISDGATDYIIYLNDSEKPKTFNRCFSLLTLNVHEITAYIGGNCV